MHGPQALESTERQILAFIATIGVERDELEHLIRERKAAIGDAALLAGPKGSDPYIQFVVEALEQIREHEDNHRKLVRTATYFRFKLDALRTVMWRAALLGEKLKWEEQPIEMKNALKRSTLNEVLGELHSEVVYGHK